MPLLPVLSLLYVTICAVAGKNALYGYDVVIHSDPYAPRIVLVDDKQNSYVDLSASAFTWCINTFYESKEGKNVYCLAGYASKEHNDFNEIVIGQIMSTGVTFIDIRSERTSFSVLPEFNKWTLTCLSWESENGTLRYYLDGKEVGKAENVKKGSTIGKNGILSVGQDQDDYDAKYEVADGMEGRITQVNTWNRVLTEKELQNVMAGKLFGNVVDWRNSYWALAGNAILLPTEAPNAASQKATCSAGEETLATDLSICLRYNGDSCPADTFTLFYYMNQYGTKEFSLIVNETNSASVVIGIEDRIVPHVTVAHVQQHWCFTWSEDTLTVYIDGGRYDELTDFSDGVKMSMNGDLYVHKVNSRKSVQPTATDYKIWERALSDAEVANEYNNEKQEMPSGYKTQRNGVGAPKIYYISSGVRSIPDSSPYMRHF